MIRILRTLALGLVLVAGVETAQAGPGPNVNPQASQVQPQVQPNQNPQVQNPPAQDNRPIVHEGREDLPGMGELMFVFSNDGKVQMIDATRRPVNGTYTLVGSRLTISFTNCVYEGNVVEGVCDGTARFTTGQNAGQSWNFNTRFTGRL